MNPVPIDLTSAPGARLITNSLCASTESAELDGDLVLVELPGGRFIDVSWSPEHDPSGSYFVIVFPRDDWDHPLDVAEARDPAEAGRLVERLAGRHFLAAGVEADLLNGASGGRDEFIPSAGRGLDTIDPGQPTGGGNIG